MPDIFFFFTIIWKFSIYFTDIPIFDTPIYRYTPNSPSLLLGFQYFHYSSRLMILEKCRTSRIHFKLQDCYSGNNYL